MPAPPDASTRRCTAGDCAGGRSAHDCFGGDTARGGAGSDWRSICAGAAKGRARRRDATRTRSSQFTGFCMDATVA